MRQLLTSLSLPILYAICWACALVLAFSLTGTTQAHYTVSGGDIPLAGISAALQAMPDHDISIQSASPDSIHDETDCPSPMRTLVVETPPWSTVDVDQIGSVLREHGVAICQGPRFKFNAPSMILSKPDVGLFAVSLVVLALLAMVAGICLRSAPVREALTARGFQVGDAVLGLLAAAVLYAALMGINMAFHGEYPTPAPILAGHRTGPRIPFILIIGAVSIMEELVYRAWLITHARPALGVAGAVILSCVTFSAMHLIDGPDTLIFYLLAGTLFSVLWTCRRSILTCATGHAAYNLAIFLWHGN